KQAGTTIELAGKEKIGDRDAYVLVIKPMTGPSVREYIDAASYLLIKQVVKINVPQLGSELEQTTGFFDFKDVDGVKIPFRIKTSSSLQTLTINVAQIEHNVQIDQTLFSKPDAGK